MYKVVGVVKRFLPDTPRFASRERGQGCVAHFRAAIDINASDARAYYNLGLALEQKGDSEGARQARRSALELDPTLGRER
jgi:Flp pilus assembly protein TadD